MVSDRNKYVADNGSGIMPQLPELLCSRCHGLIYNDWLMGTHGKWVGMWKPTKKSDRRPFTCTQCHDPHDPSFFLKAAVPIVNAEERQLFNLEKEKEVVQEAHY